MSDQISNAVPDASFWQVWKPMFLLCLTTTLKFGGGFLVAHGVITAGPGYEEFIGAGMTAGAAIWSWWLQRGNQLAANWFKHVMDTATTAAAVEVAKRLPPPTIAGPVSDAKAAVVAAKIASAIAVALISMSLVFPQPLFAQGGTTTPARKPAISLTPPPLQITGDPIADTKANVAIIKSQFNTGTVATGVIANDDGTVTCNFNIFANLKPENLVATIKACVSEANTIFAPDVDAALASATAYGNNGDTPAVQCLKPASNIIHAAILRPAVPAVAAQAAVPATATTPAIPAVVAVPGTPAYSPGPTTLFQKYREFTLDGGITACQTWIQSTTNATLAGVAGGVVGATGLVAGAAALAPVK